MLRQNARTRTAVVTKAQRIIQAMKLDPIVTSHHSTRDVCGRVSGWGEARREPHTFRADPRGSNRRPLRHHGPPPALCSQTQATANGLPTRSEAWGLSATSAENRGLGLPAPERSRSTSKV